MTEEMNSPAEAGASGEPETAAQANQESGSSDASIGPNAATPASAEMLPEYTMDDVPERLRSGFEQLGWTSLMPVQARGIPYILAHRDVMIQSRTGSGKTGAYLVPLFQRINPDINATQALVLVPTRELAQQVIHEAEVLGSTMNVRTAAVYGGVGYREQLDAFKQGAHLVVGTPGRILDHLLRRSLTLDRLKAVVFDEADRMLSMGFYPDMKRVQRYLPRGPMNAYMFSATFPPRVLALASEFMQQPDFLNLSSDRVYVAETQHVFYNVPPMDKERSLIRIIEVENPASAIVFCNTKERVHFVAVILQRYGYNAAEISSDLSQAAREAVMEEIRRGTLRFLVATDVASRGIDIPDLSHVILYEVPDDPESYIHRAGRTGRAGASGVAISLVNALEKVELTRIRRRFEIELQERPVPTDEEVQAIIDERTEALLETRLRERDRLQTERMKRFIPFLRQLGDEEEDLSGVAMLLDDFYHENFHAVQTLQPDGRPAEPRRPQEREPERPPRKNRSESTRAPGHGGGRPAERGAVRRTTENSPAPAREDRAAAPAADASAPGDSTGASTRRRRRRGGRGKGPKPTPENP